MLTTNNRPIGDWSIFCVDPAAGAAGWPPHRDRVSPRPHAQHCPCLSAPQTHLCATLFARRIISSAHLEPCRLCQGTDESASAFRADGTPHYCTVWVALTDATPANSCLMVVPKDKDKGYSEGDKGKTSRRWFLHAQGCEGFGRGVKRGGLCLQAATPSPKSSVRPPFPSSAAQFPFHLLRSISAST